MNSAVNSISARLSLRQPQRDSLEILARVADLLPLRKDQDLTKALEAIRQEFKDRVTDFERSFPSICFALATGVGKTRLMGAFITYLYQAKDLRNFFVLAPNLTIYNKLIADFTRGNPKYVFEGIADFVTNPPEIITGDNYESGRAIRSRDDLFGRGRVNINIFNISKINSEVRGGKEPRIKRLQECIGESHFAYLSGLDDLVLLMDESHRYRATAGAKAINELQPILGLELTATPQIEKGAKSEPFKNVIYSYPLPAALRDGFVKEPVVASRENFDKRAYDEPGLEQVKLRDAILVHEKTKLELENFARQFSQRLVKPFILIVAEDTKHAESVKAKIEDASFYGGQYRGKVITVHSNLTGEEKDETVEQLLSVEDPNNPTEIVIHVNMLKEGWDVTNLYTIVPLRAANSRTLVEQSIGRGLRLPYGKRVGIPEVDCLTIVSHDNYNEIIDYAKNPNSIIRRGVIIGKDIPEAPPRRVVIPPKYEEQLIGGGTEAATSTPLFTAPAEVETVRATLDAIDDFPKFRSSLELTSPKARAELADRVRSRLTPAQREFFGGPDAVDVDRVVNAVVDQRVKFSIDIPRVTLVPTGEVVCTYQDFDLDTTAFRYKPIDNAIVVTSLTDDSTRRLDGGDGVVPESRPENYIVRGLMDFDDVNYDDNSELLNKLANGAVRQVQSSVNSEAEAMNILQNHGRHMAGLIRDQILAHRVEKPLAFEAKIVKGFIELKAVNSSAGEGEFVRNYRDPVDRKSDIREMLFGGFKRCCYSTQKFQSDREREFVIVLEDDKDVVKWIKPAPGSFTIGWSRDDRNYNPDFVVETLTGKFICEVKDVKEMNDPEVLAKAHAAAEWCRQASTAGGKPWEYLLISDASIDRLKTIAFIRAGCPVFDK